jgi:hypothetical protein
LQDEPNQPEITLDDLDKAPAETKPTGTDTSVSKDAYVHALSRITEENSRLKEEKDALTKKVKTAEILDELIEPYAKKAYRFMCVYSGFVNM